MKKHNIFKIFLLQILTTVCIFTASFSLFASDDKEEHGDNFVIDVLLSEEDALKQMFPKCNKILKETFILTPQEKISLQSKLKRRIFEDSFNVFVGMKDDKIDGYTVMSEEVGKFHPFTFGVCINQKGKIKNTAILIYRESRGGEISHKRFLYQYKGKSLKNPIKINKDIINITGATMSVRMMCSGVRKVLGVVDEFYLKTKRAPDSSTEQTTG